MNMGLAWRLARRELRAGVQGFRVLLLCLMLGVAAIAAVTTVRDSISAGLTREGATLLGGDAELQFTYRFASGAERSWMAAQSVALSEIADFRSMVRFGDDRALTQVKAVDGAYPLMGQVALEPDMPLSQAFFGDGETPGVVLDPVLAQRLGLSVGDRVQLGDLDVIYTAALIREPDAGGSGFTLGPRSLVALNTLEGSSLLAPGTLFETGYRLDLPEGTDLEALKQRAQSEIAEGGFRWRDARNGAPGINSFVERLSSFLVLVGLAGLAVGGVGVSAAVRAYLGRKIASIATLKTLGATRGTVLMTYLLQLGMLSLIGIAAGVALGAAVPWIASPMIERLLPVPIDTGVQIKPLIEAALYGFLASAIFVLWPLARAEQIRPAALYRDAQFGLSGWPRTRYLIAIAALIAALVGTAVVFSDSRDLVLWTFLGLALAFGILVLAGRAIAWLARRLSHLCWPLPLRLALGAVGGPGGETVSVVLSLGLGLTVLSAIGQIDTNLRGAIAQDLPDVAPSYYVVDIQKDQIEGVLARLDSDPAVSRHESAPMLRGIITRINGQDAQEVAGPHWVLRGDRGITYAARKPDNAEITAGAWWPQDYRGPPQISFAADEAEEMGLSLGDEMTVNILGRDITGTITSFRKVDFSGAGMGFILTMNPSALSAAPHSFIATIYVAPEAEAALIRDLSRSYPNITTIRVRDAIDRVASVLKGVAAATTLGALATLVTGAIVLIGAAAAGEDRRRFEAAVLKTLGASRATILLSFALRALVIGLGAGAIALVAGATAAWAVIHFVMQGEFGLAIGPALAIILGGVAMTLATSLLFSMRAMTVRPARVLRLSEG